MYAQEENFEKFTQNILDLETWEPITEGVHHSSSVTDMFAMFRQTMDFFFRMELGVPEFLTHLLDFLASSQKFIPGMLSFRPCDRQHAEPGPAR